MPHDLEHVILATNHPKQLHAAIIRDYSFTSSEYAHFIRMLWARRIDFEVRQLGPGDYYRFSFRCGNIPWLLPDGKDGVNKSPLKII